MKYQDEVKAFITKAERSLKAGKVLLSEGDYDFAISRFYYSMFYCAEVLLLIKDMKFSKHSAVISYFGREFIKTGTLSQKLHSYFINHSRKEGKEITKLFFSLRRVRQKKFLQMQRFLSPKQKTILKREDTMSDNRFIETLRKITL